MHDSISGLKHSIKCYRCGRFMGYDACDKGHCDFTPDTAFSSERVEWYHEECYKDLRSRSSSSGRTADL